MSKLEKKLFTKSKIVCTLGPASEEPDRIKKLSDLGMDVARLNFSHGSIEYKKKLFNRIRQVDPNLAILCDIQGPKIRIGFIRDNGAVLYTGDSVTITTEDIEGDGRRFSISHKQLPQETEPGHFIFINDGIVCLKVKEIEGTEIRCKVLSGGFISSKKGVNLPDTKISIRVPTEKDKDDLSVIAKLEPEFVAISFVQDAMDVLNVKEVLAQSGNSDIKLISKIERPVALENFDEILGLSDGIMVARGDLGVEVPFEKIIPAQKEMIYKANKSGKPIIVATQMLESMVNTPIPTRAEVSDVFNAIEDGADAVMLSAETAAGKFPMKCVDTMEKIIKVSEDNIPPRNPNDFDSNEETIAEIIGHLVHNTCTEFKDMEMDGISMKNSKILCLTRSGLSARMVSKYRPALPIIAVTMEHQVARELRLVWGVEAVVIPGIHLEKNPFIKIQKSTNFCIEKGYVTPDEQLVCVGNMEYLPARTNMVSIFKVQDILDSLE
ncbi:pyruvate kinase [Candidatus Bathyarchaeota archaeon]|nr:pyruvate kinase [Candidatus Bathyarchaeota archaeon]